MAFFICEISKIQKGSLKFFYVLLSTVNHRLHESKSVA
jgi:hypothetical protein